MEGSVLLRALNQHEVRSVSQYELESGFGSWWVLQLDGEVGWVGLTIQALTSPGLENHGRQPQVILLLVMNQLSVQLRRRMPPSMRSTSVTRNVFDESLTFFLDAAPLT